MELEKSEFLLSVIIPVAKNTSDLSHLEQSIRNNYQLHGIEFVIVIDGLIDQPNPHLDQIQSKFVAANVKFLTVNCGNPGGARNFGYENSQGSRVLFWDADDVGDLRTFLAEVRASTADILVSQYEARYLSNELISTSETAGIVSLAINPGIWRLIFRTEVIRQIRFPSLSMGEDQVYILEAIKNSDTISFSDSITYQYFTGNPKQLTNQVTKMQDLAHTMRLIAQVLADSKGSSVLVALIMLSRQLVSAIKFGEVRTKLTCISILLGASIRALPKVGWSILSGNHLDHSRLKIKQSGIVKVYLTGGMGNQLFQIAAGLSLSKDGRVYVVQELGNPRVTSQGLASALQFDFHKAVSISHDEEFGVFWKKCAGWILRRGVSEKKLEQTLYLGKNLDRIVIFLLRARFKFRYKILSARGVGYCELEVPSSPTLLIGYFQSYKWLASESAQATMRLMSTPRWDETLEYYREKAERENPLILHIRLGDYVNEPDIGLLPNSYYHNALKEILLRHKFGKIWVFSDEIDLAISKLPPEILPLCEKILVPENSDALTLQIMRYGEGYVLSNSTFGWWAANLSHSASPVVIVPDRWFYGLPEPESLIPNNWIRVSAWPK